MGNNRKQQNKGKIMIYKTKDNKISLDVRLEKETVWLTQKQMAKLFNRDVRTVNEHIKNVFKEGELNKSSVIRKFRITAADGKSYTTNFYNLDVIISIGYRVNSFRGTQFRIWATKTLKSHLVKGYTINQKRLKETNLNEFEQAVKLVKRTIGNKKLDTKEAKGLLKVITDYANSWILLQKYDKRQLEIKKTTKVKHDFDYSEVVSMIEKLKIKLVNKKQASELFGTEREQGLKGILGNINQGFNGQQLYPSIEQKAAHLLYFTIKDHPFIDGNKRIGSFLFIMFLAENSYLFNKQGEKKFNNNALVALALLIAESNPRDKNTMIKLIANFLNE